jgi:sigma-B regulation protein RsbU (phosphoserine phosphatase)
VRIVMFVMSVFILQLFLVVLVFAAWSVGESSARSVWPSKLTGADSALARRYLTVDLGRGLVRGYCWGFILLGVSAVFLFLFLGRDGLHAIARSAHGVPEGLVPFLSPVTNAVFDAAFGEIIFRLFFLSFLKEKTGRTWIGVAVSTVLWTLTGLSMWQLPFGSLLPVATVLMLAAFGLAFSFLFLRYDLVTSITANFVVLALPNAIPLLTSSGPAFAAAEWGFFALMGLPLVLGVVAVVRGVPFEFTPDTLPAHVKRISERVRMAKELEIARTVQMSLLPKENPHQEGLDIAGICLPAQEVGGDYYDFIGMGGRRIGIALGDVSGKGVPAAIYMTLTKGILQSHAEDNVSPKTVLSKVNALMYRTIERNSFVSMLYAVLDLDSRTIRFARAGQCPVILTQPASMPAEFLSPRGMALGLEMGKVFDAVLEEEEMPLRSGETLVFYTDGFTEAMTEREEEFGEARLVESVRRHRHLPAPDVIRAVVDDVRTFTSGHPQHDDMTMVVVKVA